MDRLLFVAPAVPRPTGGGLRMRGWLFLRGLARHSRITLIAGSPGFPDESTDDLAALGDLIEDAVLLRYRARHDPGLALRRLASGFGLNTPPSWDWASPTAGMRRSLARLRGREFAGVRVFRLYMLPTALAALGADTAVPLQLDLDDWESRTRLAILRLAVRQASPQARRLRAEAVALEAQERVWLPRCARVFVCSEADAATLADSYGLQNVAVVRNAVTVPPRLPAMEPVEPAELLFVGSLGYAPNAHAVRFLLDEVLPRLRATLPRPFRLALAGTGAPRGLRARLRSEPNVTWIDAPPRIEPLYTRATAALAPVHAGGGTRIKVLEAFAQGRPLVATAAAVAGLDVEPGVHYLRAEDAPEWAERIRMLLETPALAARLAATAHAWVRRHTLESEIEHVAALTDPSSRALPDDILEEQPA